MDLRRYRDLATLLAAGVGVVAYSYAVSPQVGSEVHAWIGLDAALDGDLPQYVWRFAMSFLLLGLVPFSTALLLGHRPRDLGLRAPRSMGPGWIWPLVAGGSVLVAAIGAYDPSMSAYYPYSKTLLERISSRGFAVFGLHALLYIVLFYVPWELVFRGILVFPVLRAAGTTDAGALLLLASLQAVPSALSHVGHPALESFGSLGFGVAAGYLALRTGSILPGLAVHAGVGVIQDLLLAFRFVGILP